MDRVIIDDLEVIVRALKTPQHYDFKKKRLKPAAFRPPRGSSVISVARPHGVHHCREKIRLSSTVSAQYMGLGAIFAKEIRIAGSDLQDAPEDFDGHAHIDHGIVMPADSEPLPAEENLKLNTKLKYLAASTAAYPDPDPSAETWTGAELLPPTVA